MSIILGKYKILKKLGRGAYGDVSLIEDQKKIKYALKQISKKKVQEDQFLLEYLMGEKDCMVNVKSQYAVELIEMLEDEKNYYMVLQYCNGGDLFNQQAKKKNKIFSLDEAVQILSHIIKGLEFIHDKNYLHRDIKSQNILINFTDANIKEYKLADFGFSKPVNQTNGTVLGTPDFMSPQIFLEEQYSFQVDMWAFGVLFYFMLNSEYPFKKVSNPHLDLEVQRDRLMKAATNFSYSEWVSKSRKKLVENCTPQLEDLFQRMFHPEAEERITFVQIRKHPVFQKHFPIIEEKSKFLYNYKPVFTGKSALIKKSAPYSFDKEKEVIDEKFRRIKFLWFSIQKIEEIQKQLQKPLKISFAYNILKCQLISLRNFQKELQQSIQNSHPTLKFRQFRKNESFKQQIEKINSEQKEVQFKLKEIYENCYNNIKSIKPINKYFQGSLEKQVTQDELQGNFKASFRQSTSKIYENLKEMIVSQTSPNIKYYHIAIITIDHFFNYFLKAKNEVLVRVFSDYCLQKQTNKIEFKDLATWITETNKKNVEDMISKIVKEFAPNK